MVHFGHSLLFVRNGLTTSTYFVRVIIRAEIEFFTFDGDRAVLSRPISNAELIEQMKALTFRETKIE